MTLQDKSDQLNAMMVGASDELMVHLVNAMVQIDDEQEAQARSFRKV